MSRTRKTDPPRVRAARGEVGAYPLHPCRNTGRACDLPERPTGECPDTACQWVAYHPTKNLCGCPMCTGADDRRQDRRRERHGAARDIAARLAD